jgi:formate/nitrite transporter FocA (FNT family)
MVDNPSSTPGGITPNAGERHDDEVEDAFDRLVDAGQGRLTRPLLPLLSTAFVGGIDVGIGVLVYLVVKAETGSSLLAALSFPVGFVALLLNRNELFTENFLVPVTATVAGKGTLGQLLRLWTLSLAANLIGGLVMAVMIVVALPDVRDTAVQTGVPSWG